MTFNSRCTELTLPLFYVPAAFDWVDIATVLCADSVRQLANKVSSVIIKFNEIYVIKN